MSNALSKTMGRLQFTYRYKPVEFAKHIIGIDLSEQQKKLIIAAAKSSAMSAVKSATGTGKTTTLAILILHQLFCEPNCKIIATSPSAGQLQRGLRSEISKMHSLIKVKEVRDYFDMTQEKIFAAGRKDTQFCSLVTGSAENQESLAGVHADKVLVIVDEASALSQVVYDTLVGNLTTPGCSITLTSNPVRSSGAFFDLFSNPDNGTLWKLFTFTAFDSPMVSEEWIEMIRLQYGEDSDFYRMRVLGEFSKSTSTQFIPANLVEDAIKNQLAFTAYHHYPKVLGVDIARFGDDSTVLVLRQGPKILDIQQFFGLDTMEVAAKVVEYDLRSGPSMIFIDGIGIGAGVVDRCRQLPAVGKKIVDVVVSSKSSEPLQYVNLRAQLYGKMKQWLENGADVPNNNDLSKQFMSMEYGYNGKMQLQLMSKKDIKRQGLASPDIPDAIALTFAAEAFNFTGRVRGPRRVKKSSYLWI